jgi:hypothetical protein
MDTSVQILKIALKVLLVVPTCQPIHSSCGILLEFRECLCEVINTDVMEERGELLAHTGEGDHAVRRMETT